MPFFFFSLMGINTWKVQNMRGKVVMLPFGYVEDGWAITAGKFIFLKPQAAMVVASGMMEHSILEAFTIDFPSLHHEMHVAFPDHEEGDP